jgi:hypothetical protein
MKKAFYFVFATLLGSMVFTSCELDDITFDDAMLVGKWRSENVFYRYDATGTGVTWDISDDVLEEEGDQFTWTLSDSELKHIYVLEFGQIVPKVYTVTKLNLTKLEYEDDFGKTFSFTKVLN